MHLESERLHCRTYSIVKPPILCHLNLSFSFHSIRKHRHIYSQVFYCTLSLSSSHSHTHAYAHTQAYAHTETQIHLIYCILKCIIRGI